MSMKRPSPLVGYNTGIVYRGTAYHVQTEDSGVEHPHVITHLFIDGGRIIATRRTSYAEQVGTPAYPGCVQQLIRAQHKAMLKALRDGAYDDNPSDTGARPASTQVQAIAGAAPPSQDTLRREPGPARASQPSPPLSSPPAIAARARPAKPAPFLGPEDSLHDIIIADLIGQLDE